MSYEPTEMLADAVNRLADIPGLERLSSVQSRLGVRFVAAGDLPRRLLLAKRFPRAFPQMDVFKLVPQTNTITLIFDGDSGESQVLDAIYDAIPFAEALRWNVHACEDLDRLIATRADKASSPVRALALRSDTANGLLDPMGAAADYENGAFRYFVRPSDEEPAVLFNGAWEYLRDVFEAQSYLQITDSEVWSQDAIPLVRESILRVADGLRESDPEKHAALEQQIRTAFGILITTASSANVARETLEIVGLPRLLQTLSLESQRLVQILLSAKQNRKAIVLSSFSKAGATRLPLVAESWMTGNDADAELAKLVADSVGPRQADGIAINSYEDNALIAIEPLLVRDFQRDDDFEIETHEYIFLELPFDAKTRNAISGYSEQDLAPLVALEWVDRRSGERRGHSGFIFALPSAINYGSGSRNRASLYLRIDCMGLLRRARDLVQSFGDVGQPTIRIILMGADDRGSGKFKDARSAQIVPVTTREIA